MSSFPPARSALNLRAALAVFGLVVCVALAVSVWRAREGVPGAEVAAAVLALGAVVALVDLAVIQRRRAARRDAEATGQSGDHSLFE